jgi:hypothetical protein
MIWLAKLGLGIELPRLVSENGSVWHNACFSPQSENERLWRVAELRKSYTGNFAAARFTNQPPQEVIEVTDKAEAIERFGIAAH